MIMGDRVRFQCMTSDSDFGPSIYCHWKGDEADKYPSKLKARMGSQTGDVSYATARLAQILMEGDNGCSGFGIDNEDHVLTADDSPGDAGVVLINVDTFEATYLGGSLSRRERNNE